MCLLYMYMGNVLLLQDVKLKNTGSWASLASLSSNTPSQTKKPLATQSFELFRRQAQEREERVRIYLYSLLDTEWGVWDDISFVGWVNSTSLCLENRHSSHSFRLSQFPSLSLFVYLSLFCLSLSVCVCLSLSFCLSRMHTHRHIHRERDIHRQTHTRTHTNTHTYNRY